MLLLVVVSFSLTVFFSHGAVSHFDAGDFNASLLYNATAEQRQLVYGGEQVGETYLIQRSYDFEFNWTTFKPCVEWKLYWDYVNLTEYADTNNVTEIDVGGGQQINITQLDEVIRPDEMLWIALQAEAELFGFGERLQSALSTHTNVSIHTHTVCAGYGSVLWLNSSTNAQGVIGLDEQHRELFCKPYELSLEPTQLMFTEFEILLRTMLDDQIETSGGLLIEQVIEAVHSTNQSTYMLISAEYLENIISQMHLRLQAAADVKPNITIVKEDGDEFVTSVRNGRQVYEEVWDQITILDNVTTVEEIATDLEFSYPWEGHPVVYFYSNIALLALGLRPTVAFYRYPTIGIDLIGLCQGVVPRKDENEKDQELLGDNVVGGMQQLSFVNDTELSIFLRNDVRVDNIFELFKAEPTSLGATHMHFMFNRSQYDVRTAPIYYRDNPVKVRVGIYIGSLSNFETNTMDYDMDVYLKMAWRDPRLMHEYSKPILIKDKEYLDQVWLPDPYFGNSKESEFHDVTVPNFLMRVFQKGEVYYEQRLKLTPSCNLVLCKYPHDKQSCSLTIGSYAYPTEELQFEWFSDADQAVKIHPEVELPDLYIERITPVQCDGYRFGGNFTFVLTNSNFSQIVILHA